MQYFVSIENNSYNCWQAGLLIESFKMQGIEDQLLIGVAENRAEFIYGCDRYCVQPQIGEDGKIPDSVMIDEPQLELVADREPVMPPPLEPVRLFEMGQEVTDPIRCAKGIITGRAIYLNGCARVLISPKQASTKDLSSWWVDEQQLVAGKKKIDAPAREKKLTGGPAASSSKY